MVSQISKSNNDFINCFNVLEPASKQIDNQLKTQNIL